MNHTLEDQWYDLFEARNPFHRIFTDQEIYFYDQRNNLTKKKQDLPKGFALSLVEPDFESIELFNTHPPDGSKVLVISGNFKEVEAYSITPLMTQSQWIPLIEATGDVVILGIGSGWLLSRIMQKPDVYRIRVWEKDPSVINLFTYMWSHDPGYKKIIFNCSDARSKKTGFTGISCDYCFSDIYDSYISEQAFHDMIYFNKTNKIETYHFWMLETIYFAAVYHDIIPMFKVPRSIHAKLFLHWTKGDDRDNLDKGKCEMYIQHEDHVIENLEMLGYNLSKTQL